MENKLLKTKDVADFLGCKTNYVYQLVAQKKIRYIKIDGLLRFKQEFLDELVNANIN